MKKFTRHDEEMLRIFMDPVLWAKHHLGEAPRWYQEDILRHPHHRKVLRCGRRIGKTWTMTAHMLYTAFTCNGGKNIKKGATCLVATPYESQAREIFDQLKTFIDNNPVLQDSIKSITKNPYYIEFKNKSRIKLFTAGTRSGAEGGSLRGQKADWLYMDEMDYLSDKDFEAIYAITLEAPQRIGVMVASTPTGRRGKFYDLCTDSELRFNQNDVCVPGDAHDYEGNQYDRSTAEGWKEFYFPTMVNPEWDHKMERELRKTYTSVAYEHEVMAEFGTEMIGVFNKEFIDEACSKPYAFHPERKSDAPIAIGVDWDKFGAATQIVITQFNPHDPRRVDEDFRGMGRFTVINRIEIAKGDFTYDNAVKKIIELAAIYDPAFIYADRGSGEYQIELLRKALGDLVHGVHLGSSHLVRDPYSREFDKKPIKPFMVNQATLMLERGQLRIPHRDTDEMIYRQMTNYQVVRVSPKTGEPTFTNKDEHALDAMMLCLLGFIIEMPELAKTVEAITVARSMGFSKTRFNDPISQTFRQDATRQDANLPSYMKNWDEIGAPPPRKVGLGYRQKNRNTESGGWARGATKSSMPSRKSW